MPYIHPRLFLSCFRVRFWTKTLYFHLHPEYRWNLLILIILFCKHLNLHLIRSCFYRLQCFLHLIQYLTLSSHITCSYLFLYLLFRHLSLLELIIQSVSEVWPIREIVKSPLPWRHPIEAPVQIFKQPYHYIHSPLIYFSLSPCELLTHPTLPTQYLEWLPDIRYAGRFYFRVFENPWDLHVEQSLDQICEQKSIGELSLDQKEGVYFKRAIELRKDT